MTNLQKYVIESLFARNQMTKAKFEHALSCLEDIDVDRVLNSLVASEADGIGVGVMLEDLGTARLKVIQRLKDMFGLSLAEAKSIGDIIPCTLNQYTDGMSYQALQNVVVQLREEGAVATIFGCD